MLKRIKYLFFAICLVVIGFSLAKIGENNMCNAQDDHSWFDTVYDWEIDSDGNLLLTLEDGNIYEWCK